MERMQSYGPPGSQWTPMPAHNTPPNGYNLATQQQQQQQQQQQSQAASSSTISNQHSQNPDSPENRGIPVASSDKSTTTQTDSQRPSQSSITSPAASPYPSANCSVTGMYAVAWDIPRILVLFCFFFFPTHWFIFWRAAHISMDHGFRWPRSSFRAFRNFCFKESFFYQQLNFLIIRDIKIK